MILDVSCTNTKQFHPSEVSIELLIRSILQVSYNTPMQAALGSMLFDHEH